MKDKIEAALRGGFFVCSWIRKARLFASRFRLLNVSANYKRLTHESVSGLNGNEAQVAEQNPGAAGAKMCERP
jgi:hypothetical protein